MGKYIFFALLAAGVAGVGIFANSPQEEPPIVRIGNASLIVEIAADQETRSVGLSGREALEESAGMLFVFDAPERAGFWMKDMQFPIDIIWIGDDKKVQEIAKNVAPETFPEAFYPERPMRYVLETNAGWAERNGIEPGDDVVIPNEGL